MHDVDYALLNKMEARWSRKPIQYVARLDNRTGKVTLMQTKNQADMRASDRPYDRFIVLTARNAAEALQAIRDQYDEDAWI